MAPKVKGVIFDMDGLMFDTERIWDTFWVPCCRKLGLPDPPQAFYSGGRGLAGDGLRAHIAEFYGSAAGELLEEVWRYGDEQFDRGVPCKPGLKELLEYLEQIGLPRIVASSSPKAMIERNLQTTGTARYFHDVVCGYDVDKCKPDPAIFLEAARRIGVDIHDCLVLEDSHNGVRAGHASGAVTVMVPDLMPVTSEMKTLYNFCCKDLYEVRALLEAGTL
ncbi:HAD family hydrolase [Gemmiger sp.]|uniref:HAD family hydrolase n=1 Tax=Gemmiger sp. TaxID=2049027 RepID=UPI003F03A087